MIDYRKRSSLWQTAWDLISESDQAFSATSAHDGIPNGIKYALGIEPRAPAADHMHEVSISTVSGSKYLTLTYVRPNNVNRPTDLLYEVERSTNLSAPGGGVHRGGVQESVDPGPDGGYETVVIRSTSPIGTPGLNQEFFHLKVTKL